MSSTVRGLQSEASLITRAQGGDRQAFYALVQPCENAVFMAAWAVLKNDAEAEDAATKAVLKAFAGLQDFKGESKFSAWIVRITIEQARLKLGQTMHPVNGADEQPSQWAPSGLSNWTEIPPDALHNPCFRKALTEAIKRLEELARTVFVLRDIQKFSIPETARILAINEGDVRARLARARLQIANELAPGMNPEWANGEPRRQRAQSC